MRTFFLSFLILANILGSIYGYLYYTGQLSRTPFHLWIFVPDCPLYTSLLSCILYARMFGFRSNIMDFLVSVGLAKYALWTLSVFVLFKDYFFTHFFIQTTVLIFLHIGMFAEAFILRMRFDKKAIAISTVWFLLNDFVDYFGPSLHPYLPSQDMSFVSLMTFSLTFIATYLVVKDPLKSKVPRIEVR